MLHVKQHNHNKDLHIDNVLSTQPELGPSIPDGGFGWIILLAAAFFQAVIPNLHTAFGVFIMFSRLEENIDDYTLSLWDNNLVFVPLLFITTWTITEPVARRIITNTTWPRLVGTAGTCLTCAGLLIMWIAVYRANSALFCILAGFVCGLGASIIITQTEVLMSQYFRLKLSTTNITLQLISAVGLIVTPMVLGHHIHKSGIMHVLIWYQAIILQGIVVCMVFKKPQYMKTQQLTYKLIRGLSDEEEDVFAKNITELQSTRQSTKSNNTEVEVTIETPPLKDSIKNKYTAQNSINSELSTSSTDVSNNYKTVNNMSTNPINLKDELSDQGWETFDDGNLQIITTKENSQEDLSKDLQKPNRFEDDFIQTSTTPTVKTPVRENLRRTFSDEANKGLDRIEKFEDDFMQTPTSLFNESPINNNTSYSYDPQELPDKAEEPVVFMPNKTTSMKSWENDIEIFKQPTFYKSLLHHVTTKYSKFIFYTLFPSYVYTKIDNIKLNHVTMLLGCIGVGGLIFVGLNLWISATSKRRAIFLWIFCWIGSIGYFMLSDFKSQSALIFGGTEIIVSICAQQILGAPLLKVNLKGETTKTHSFILSLTGMLLCLFFFLNVGYRTCFRLMALLQFLTGSVWFANFVYKKIKNEFN